MVDPSGVVGMQISAQHENVSMAESCHKTEGHILIGSVFPTSGSRDCMAAYQPEIWQGGERWGGISEIHIGV